jgi:flagellar motor component MotA
MTATRQEELHEQPIGELLKQLATETTTLVRQELDLAKAEMREKAGKAGPGFGMIGAAGGVALLALGR